MTLVAVLGIGVPGFLSAQNPSSAGLPETPDVPELIIPEELRVEADRLEAEEDNAREDREDADEERELGLTRPETPVPRFETPARSLSDLQRDERSIERLRVDCRSEISRRDITLFANGTIRLRQGPWEKQEMLLEELGPEEMTTYLKELVRIRRSDEFPEPEVDGRFTLDGQWLNACRLTVETPSDVPVIHVFNPLETQPLPVGQLLQLAERLASFTRPLEAPERLPVGYEPEIDDVLRSRDGQLFRVISPTDDGEGVELESLLEPFTVYHRIKDLPNLFASRVTVSDLELEERLLQEPEVFDLEDHEQGFSAWGKRVPTWEETAPLPPEDTPSSATGSDGDSDTDIDAGADADNDDPYNDAFGVDSYESGLDGSGDDDAVEELEGVDDDFDDDEVDGSDDRDGSEDWDGSDDGDGSEDGRSSW